MKPHKMTVPNCPQCT